MKWWYVRVINKATDDRCGVCFQFEFQAEATDFLIECMEHGSSILNHYEIYQDEEEREDD